MENSRRIVTGASPTGYLTGEAGRKRALEEREAQQVLAAQRKVQFDLNRHMPMRFWCNVGETKQFIILDESPSFFRWEHALQDKTTGKYSIHTGCVREIDFCPVCEMTGKQSDYLLFFTIIDLTPFQRKNGTQSEFSQKLLVVKGKQQPLFFREWEREKSKGGSLRGGLYETSRDGPKDSRIGNNITRVDYYTEEELKEFVLNWTDRENKPQTLDCSVVVDYTKLFETPTVESLRALIGAGPPPGSRENNHRVLNTKEKNDDEGFEDAEDKVAEEWGDDPPQPAATAEPARIRRLPRKT